MPFTADHFDNATFLVRVPKSTPTSASAPRTTTPMPPSVAERDPRAQRSPTPGDGREDA